MFNVNVLTLFPDMFPGILGGSIPGKAMEKDLWDLNVIQIRDYATNKHATVMKPIWWWCRNGNAC